MANSNRVALEDLGDAIAQELTLYHQELTDQLDKISEGSIKRLVKITRESAPKGARGDFRKNISSKRLVKRKTGSTYVWYVKPPDHRLTHLLVHGHETRNGGRTRPDPFLQNALAEVLPEHEAAIERTIKNGK